MNQNLPEKTQASSTEKVRFRDGMIVTAEDLQDAMSYPVDVFRTLVRAFLGCGIVCGLEVRKCESVVNDCSKQSLENDPEHAVCITPGVAIDCHGYPIELCRAVTLEFPEDNCGEGYKACIAIRRAASKECPRPTDDCSSGSNQAEYECTRLREQVQVKAFPYEEPPASLCRFSAEPEAMAGEDPCVKKEEKEKQKDRERGICACLKSCERGLCCDEAWVLLACVEVGKDGLELIDETWRKYVKPIDCLCRKEPVSSAMPVHWREEVAEMISEAGDEAGLTHQVGPPTPVNPS